MKIRSVYLLIALTALACTKDVTVPTDGPGVDLASTYPTSIRAGQETGVGIDHLDFVPNVNFDALYVLCDSIYVDMNADLTNDFMLTYCMSNPFTLGAEWDTLRIFPMGGNQICVDPADHSLADSLLFDEVIDAHRTWSDTTAILFHRSSTQAGSSSSSGYFLYNSLHYIGIRMNMDQDTLYGWIYLDHLSLDKLGVTTAYPE